MPLLNRVLHLSGADELQEIQYLERAQTPNHAQHKLILFDLLVRDQRGTTYEIEVQRADEGEQLARALYYGARALGQQLVHAEPYEQLRPVRVVMLTAFNLFPDPHPIRTFYPTPHLISEAAMQRPRHARLLPPLTHSSSQATLRGPKRPSSAGSTRQSGCRPSSASPSSSSRKT